MNRSSSIEPGKGLDADGAPGVRSAGNSETGLPLEMSFPSGLFGSRGEAAQMLAESLSDYRPAEPQILGIPRGGAVLAAAVADGLSADLDLMLAAPITGGAEEDPKLGAVAELFRAKIDQPETLYA